jgi:hypothetical protein
MGCGVCARARVVSMPFYDTDTSGVVGVGLLLRGPQDEAKERGTRWFLFGLADRFGQ